MSNGIGRPLPSTAWATPGAIGATTPNTGKFTTLDIAPSLASIASLGAELVTNGTFDTDLTGWTATTWTWASNRANFAGAAGAIDTVANGGIRLNTGGAGYTAGDVLTLTNGANDATITVNTVSAGVIATWSLTNAGTACVVNLATAVTGGTGSGAVFSVVKLVNSTNTLSQAVGAANLSSYQVVYTVTRTAGELLVTLGGVNGHKVIAAGTFTQVIMAIGTGSLIFTPTVDFVGSVDTVSVKLITTVVSPSTLHNSDATSGLEFRSGGSALNNSFSGIDAGKTNITGASNTATGVNALRNNTTGNSNTATGLSALSSNTTGSSNTATGTSSLLNNATGGSNTGTGTSSLLNNTTGSSNTATGVSALRNNTTGSSNTATGVSALSANTTGGSNTATGVSALVNSTTSSSNTATGANALFNNTTGASNTATGTGALSSNTTGGNNTAMGVNALGNNVTGSSNVAIGNAAAQNETGSNKLYIAISNTMLPLIYGDFNGLTASVNGAFGVRTLNPSASADIVGTNVSSSSFGLKVKNTSAELITNAVDRDFSGAGNWTGSNWSIVSAAFQHATGSTADANLANGNMTASQIVNGDMYKIVFTLSGTTAGTVTPKLGTAAGTAVGKNTTYTQYIVANANNVALIFTPTTDFDGSLDNISVTRLRNIVTVANNGAIQLGTATTDLIGEYGIAPVAQYATTGTATGFTAGAGTTVTHLSTFTGNTGSAAYTIGDIVRALKLKGTIAA